MDRICTWVNLPFLFDHAPIILQLDPSFHKLALPFKLNLGWLIDLDFSSIVFVVWKDSSVYDGSLHLAPHSVEIKNTKRSN